MEILYVEYSNLAHSMSGMVELYPSIKNVLLPKITELWCIVQGRQWNRENDCLRFTHFIYTESIEIVTLLYIQIAYIMHVMVIMEQDMISDSLLPWQIENEQLGVIS